MKKFLVASLLVFLAVSVASATVLLTPYPAGRGKFGVSLSGARTTNWAGQSDAVGNTYSISVAYGLMDNLDLDLQYGQLKTDKRTVMVAAPPAPLATLDTTINQYGALLKYNVLNDAKGAPVALSIGVGAAALNSPNTVTLPAALGGGTQSMTLNGSYGGLGVIVSKLFIPFVPYLGAQYTVSGGDWAKYYELQITAGSYIAFNRNWGCFVEYSALTDTPDGGGSSTNLNQIALSVAWSQ